jgi:hypothetical protein
MVMGHTHLVYQEFLEEKTGCTREARLWKKPKALATNQVDVKDWE